MRKASFVLLVLCGTLLVLVHRLAAAPAGTDPLVYLPVLWQAALPVTDEGTLFLPSFSNTADPVLAIDASGGLHVAYNPTSSQSGGGYPVHYAYCPNNCNEATQWTAVAVGDAGWLGEVARVALNPQGQPRMMWFFQDSLSQDGVYVYAECNQNCTNPANWQSLPLTTAFVSSGEGRYFTLDPQGRPRYLYNGSVNGQWGIYIRLL